MPPIWARPGSESREQRERRGARAAQDRLALLHAACDRVQHRERLLAAREGQVGARREAAAVPAREGLEPDDRQQHDDHDAAEGEDHALEALGHAHERQLQQHDHDERDGEHDLLGHQRACERGGRHVVALQPQAPLQHGDAPDLAQARRQQGVEQEADEERGYDIRVVEAGVIRDRVERGLPDDRLEQDRGQVQHQRREHPPPGDVDVADGAEVDRAQRQLEQHGEEHEAEGDAPGRRALGGRLGGELGDGHELVARGVRALHDLGHGFGRLAAVVARAAAVGVVQQQDPARPEADGGAPHDRLDAGLGGVPDALRPADDGVAAARGRARHERIAEPVRRTEEQRMRLVAERALERRLGARELAVDVGLRGERQQCVVVAVGGDLVPLVADAAHEVGVLLDMAAEHEEGRARTARPQRVEHARRPLRRRAVVECQRQHALVRPAPGHDLAEERRVGREGGPGPGHDGQADDAEDRPAGPARERGADDGGDGGTGGDHHGRGTDEAPHDRRLPHLAPRLPASSSA